MCKHLNTQLQHKVVRMTEPGKPDSYMMEAKLRCLDCGIPFRFVTPKMGVLPDQPTTGPERLEIRIPLQPDIVMNN